MKRHGPTGLHHGLPLFAFSEVTPQPGALQHANPNLNNVIPRQRTLPSREDHHQISVAAFPCLPTHNYTN